MYVELLPLLSFLTNFAFPEFCQLKFKFYFPVVHLHNVPQLLHTGHRGGQVEDSAQQTGPVRGLHIAGGLVENGT
jgi:hypothetical protein